MALDDLTKDSAVQASIVNDCDQLITTHVSQKSGVSGVALKTAHRIVKGIGPTYIPGAISRMLPSTLEVLDPLWQEAMTSGDPVAYLEQHRSRTADLILSVTDHRIQYTSGPIIGVYNKLRKSVKGDIEAVVPELAGILHRHHIQLLQRA
ncbi:DUF6918 family protein [Leptolyngbya iicbica]|uniref:Uncharacterized protein n=2 Tax=Cyanophyceae TaxID=3028117 RepID=A0A4Q7EBM9_9CYAN|nr:hypothetical protein [Leptolyngbya sp. LK]RZM78625.1 hypothetical protein DYY88_07410 [Leptolyngbya sp. LK]